MIHISSFNMTVHMSIWNGSFDGKVQESFSPFLSLPVLLGRISFSWNLDLEVLLKYPRSPQLVAVVGPR